QRRLCREDTGDPKTARGAWWFPRSVRPGVEGRGRRGHAARDRTTRDGTLRVRGCVHRRRDLRPAQADAPITRRRFQSPSAGGRVPLLPARAARYAARVADARRPRSELPNGRWRDAAPRAVPQGHSGADDGPSDGVCGDAVGIRRRSITEGHARRDARNVGDEARAYGHRGFPESPRRNLDSRRVAVPENAALCGGCHRLTGLLSVLWFPPVTKRPAAS